MKKTFVRKNVDSSEKELQPTTPQTNNFFVWAYVPYCNQAEIARRFNINFPAIRDLSRKGIISLEEHQGRLVGQWEKVLEQYTENPRTKKNFAPKEVWGNCISIKKEVPIETALKYGWRLENPTLAEIYKQQHGLQPAQVPVPVAGTTCAVPSAVGATVAESIVEKLDDAESVQDLESILRESLSSATKIEDAKRFREIIRAKKEGLNLLKEMGSLVDVDEMAQAYSELAVRVRKKLLSIPVRCSAQLAIESEPVKVEKILAEEIRLALGELDQDISTVKNELEEMEIEDESIEEEV